MLILYVTLWPWLLTCWPWKFVGQQASRDQSLERIIDKFANFCTHYVTLWPWPLTCWPWTFIAHGCHAFKLCTKFERLTHRWVIDGLARFRRAIYGVGHDWQRVLRGAWTPLYQTWWGHRAIISHKKFVSAFGYLAAFSNASTSKLSDVKSDAKFRTFWPLLWKIRGGVGKIYIPIVEALPTTEPPKYIRWPSTHGCWAWLIDKKRKKEK